MNATTRPRLLPLLLGLLALGLAGCNAECLGDCLENTQAEDSAARVEYYKDAAKTYYDGGRYDAAVKMWDKVLADSPDDQWAKFGLAKSLHMLGTPDSLRRAQAILTDIQHLCWVHPVRGDVKFEIKTTLANVYSDRADLYDRDARSLEARLEAGACADTKALYQNVQCQKARRDEFLRLSIPVWNEVLCANKRNQYALAGLAKAHLIAGDENMGIQYAQEYVQLSRDSQIRWRQQQQEWFRTQGNRVTDEQKVLFRDRIMGAREKEIGMRLLLASVYMRREQFSRAVKEYDEVIAIDAAVPAAYVERAQAYAALGIYGEAVKDLESYLKMTDPQKQRRARVHAAELLDRYRLIAEGPARPQTTHTPTSATPRPAPRTAPSPRGYGSPDGAPVPPPPSRPPAPSRAHGSPDG